MAEPLRANTLPLTHPLLRAFSPRIQKGVEAGVKRQAQGFRTMPQGWTWERPRKACFSMLGPEPHEAVASKLCGPSLKDGFLRVGAEDSGRLIGWSQSL